MSEEKRCSEKRCSKCANFRPSDGYCRKRDRFVNALDVVEECFEPKLVPDGYDPFGGPIVKVKTRKCKVCGRELPMNSFQRSRNAEDGHLYTCKECMSSRIKVARNTKKSGSVRGKCGEGDQGCRQERIIQEGARREDGDGRNPGRGAPGERLDGDLHENHRTVGGKR